MLCIRVITVIFTALFYRVPPHANAQNAFKEWHVAFHGTAPQNVRKILDTGGLVVHGEPVTALILLIHFGYTQDLELLQV